MIQKSYYNNVQGKNILSSYTPKDLSNNNFDTIPNTTLESMIINSNLDNSNLIK